MFLYTRFKIRKEIKACFSTTLAVDRNFNSKESGEKATDFIDVVAWRATAEFVCKCFSKGRMAIAEGRLQIREWKDKDGNNRRTAEVVAENVYFGDSKREGSTSPADTGSDVYGYGTPPSLSDESSGSSGFSEISDDDGDLPF